MHLDVSSMEERRKRRNGTLLRSKPFADCVSGMHLEDGSNLIKSQAGNREAQPI